MPDNNASFKLKYDIITNYLPVNTKRRSGSLIFPSVKFVVAHDTGNPGSTADQNVRYYKNTSNDLSASAHIFVDDKQIIECIPALTAPPEKAWHVLYNVDTDNRLFGFDANDAAIGVEYCYGKSIVDDESYKKYIWVLAYICNKFSLDSAKSIVGHFFLDPKRKTDPVTGLAHSRRSYEQLLRDVVNEYNDCLGVIPEPTIVTGADTTGEVRASANLNIRQGSPNLQGTIVNTVKVGSILQYTGWTDSGQPINNNARWYIDANKNYFWSGGVIPV